MACSAAMEAASSGLALAMAGGNTINALAQASRSVVQGK